jgi:LAO/AO transport system kinase
MSKFRNLYMQTHNPVSGRLSVEEYRHGILNANRRVLGRAITLAESTLPHDRLLTEELIESILPQTGQAIRIGITGVPGVGKSTFIESFGNHLIQQGKKIAILTIDPSSQRTHGSILGDKTRMETLSKNSRAFIRPSASGDAFTGVATGTREAMLLCEAAGFEIIIIETVGIGQLEAGVRSMVDFFMLLLLAGAGDELQGIKKGILEMADGLVLTKADGDNVSRVNQARTDLLHAIHLFPSSESSWRVPVITTSALTQTGIAEVWESVQSYIQTTQTNGYFDVQRQQQQQAWFTETFQRLIQEKINDEPGLQQQQTEMFQKVTNQQVSALKAARSLVNEFSLSGSSKKK